MVVVGICVSGASLGSERLQNGVPMGASGSDCAGQLHINAIWRCVDSNGGEAALGFLRSPCHVVSLVPSTARLRSEGRSRSWKVETQYCVLLKHFSTSVARAYLALGDNKRYGIRARQSGPAS